MVGYTRVSRITEDGRITLRDHDLADEVIGRLGFTDAIHLAIRGLLPAPSERAVLDAVLVSLIDHDVTSSTLAARMTLRAAPEALQGAIAAGVLNSGGRVLGAMEGCGRLLEEWAEHAREHGPEATAARLVSAERGAGRRIPGLGHGQHESGDVRAERLFAVAVDAGHAQLQVPLLRALPEAVAEATGRRLTVNVTGAIAALLLEIGYPPALLRGFGILSRIPGLIAHLGEELETGTGGKLVRHLQGEGAWDGIG